MSIQANFPALKPALLLDFQNTKQLDSRITYTRASTASYYDGVTTAMAEQNLLTYSQEFDNAAWTKFNSTITANSVAAPDGTTTAETLTANSSTSGHNTGQSITLTIGTTYTASVYAKKNTLDYINVFVINTSSSSAFASAAFNLNTGAVASSNANGTGFAVVSSSITSVGNGWYRCVLVATYGSLGGSPAVGIALNDDGTTPNGQSGGKSFAGTSTESVYIWGAQLEARSSVTAYTVTTTQAITNYIPKLQSAASGVARFDNNPTTGESLGLLIEESRTNLLIYSEQFDNAIWSKVNSCTITANTIVAPDGTLTGDKLVRDSAANGYRVQEAISVTSGTAYTFTCYAKASQLSWIAIGSQSSFPTNTHAFFNLSSGVLGTIGSGLTSASITSVGNGWYRCSITATANATATSVFQIWLAQSDNNFSLSAGNTFDGLFLWGAQFEAGAFATSYIPTVASQVTRAADAASMTGTNFSTWFNTAEGTFYADVISGPSTAHVLTSGVGRYMYMVSGGTSLLVARIFDGTNFVASGSFALGSSSKSATSFSSSGLASCSNGGAVNTNSYDGSISDGNLYIGRLNNNTEYINGTIKKISYYPLKVTSAQLQALTS